MGVATTVVAEIPGAVEEAAVEVSAGAERDSKESVDIVGYMVTNGCIAESVLMENPKQMPRDKSILVTMSRTLTLPTKLQAMFWSPRNNVWHHLDHTHSPQCFSS